jgi:hypothetical protein
MHKPNMKIRTDSCFYPSRWEETVYMLRDRAFATAWFADHRFGDRKLPKHRQDISELIWELRSRMAAALR